MTEQPKKPRADKEQNQRDYLLALRKHDGISRLALREVGLSRETLSHWRDEVGFCEREDAVIGELEFEHLKALRKHYATNATALFFRLKALNPEQYDEGVRAARIKAEAMTDPARVKPVTVILQREERKAKDKDLKLVKGG